MSDSIVNAKTSGLALKNDALRDAFARDGVRCFLLKHNGQTKKFATIQELLTGWRVKFDDNRSESGLFRHATVNDFSDVWAETTHIAYGADAELEIYAFVDGEKDAINPDGSSVYWSSRVVRQPKERFTPPDYFFDLDGSYLIDADGFRIYG